MNFISKFILFLGGLLFIWVSGLVLFTSNYNSLWETTKIIFAVIVSSTFGLVGIYLVWKDNQEETPKNKKVSK